MRYSTKKNSSAQLREVVNDPVLFAQRILGHDVWAKQREILESVANNKRTAVQACHGNAR